MPVLQEQAHGQPKGRPTNKMKGYLALIKIDLKLALRQRSVIFFNYLFPLIFFFVFAQAFNADQGGVITQVVTMVAVIGTVDRFLASLGWWSGEPSLAVSSPPAWQPKAP